MTKQYRIRGAALVVQDNRLLLIKSVVHQTGEIVWVPPGGGLEGSESIFECAARETFEEAGVTVELDRIVYLRDFIEQESDTHHFEVFILAKSFSGTLTTENVIGLQDENYVLEAHFLSREEMREIIVYPEVLKDDFWDDLEEGFPSAKYLGVAIAQY
jgi:ADP-ribose pyrophosphatase YjhB (NUDIX family)